jgi:hypothetical protein
MSIRTYRKIPIELQAVQFTGSNFDEVHELTGPDKFAHAVDLRHFVRFEDDDIVAGVWDHLHSTWVGVKPGQWIMKGTEGEHWPVNEAVFAKSYEEVR